MSTAITKTTVQNGQVKQTVFLRITEEQATLTGIALALMHEQCAILSLQSQPIRGEKALAVRLLVSGMEEQIAVALKNIQSLPGVQKAKTAGADLEDLETITRRKTG